MIITTKDRVPVPVFFVCSFLLNALEMAVTVMSREAEMFIL